MRIITSEAYAQGIPLAIPDWVSANHVKRYRYGQEPYFQESFAELAASGIPPAELKSFTYVLVKPDGFPVRCLDRLLPCLDDDGFDVVHARRFRFDRHTVRELWRYEYNLATLDRYRLIDRLLMVGDSLLLLLRDRTGAADASIRLTELKGKSDPASRRPNALRTRIDARGGNLNHIHTPDEFIELAREIGVLFDRNERSALIDAMRAGLGGTYCDAAPLAAALHREFPVHSLRLVDAGVDASHMSQADLLDHLAALDLRPTAEFWDCATLVNARIKVSVPGVVRVLDFERGTA